jgi:hypothetical protein
MNWRLCLLILVLLPLLVLVAKFFGRRLKSLSTSIQDQTAALSTLIEEVISGIRIVKSFVQSQREETRFATQVEQTLALTMRRTSIMAVFIPVISLLTFSAAAAVLWYGGHQVIDGSVSPGDLFAFVLFAGILIGPFSSAARVFAQIREAQGATQRVFEILDTRSEVSDSPAAMPLSRLGHIRAEHVVLLIHNGLDGCVCEIAELSPSSVPPARSDDCTPLPRSAEAFHRRADLADSQWTVGIGRRAGTAGAILFGGTILLISLRDETQEEVMAAFRPIRGFIASFRTSIRPS